MLDKLLQVGHVINLDEGEGVVCFTKELDGNYYINVSFENDDNVEFKVFQVAVQGESVFFKEITDKTILEKLAAEWIVEEVENPDLYKVEEEE